MKDIKSFYFICSIQRSGSTLLCYTLRNLPGFGNPDEFVSRGSEFFWSSNPEGFFRKIFSENTRDGVFGMKAHFHQFTSVYMSKYFDLFRDPKYIYITRDDKLSQAISLVKAEEQKFWNTIYFTPPEHEIDYDYEKILRALHFILDKEHEWQAFFTASGITPHHLTYETLIKDPTGSCRRIAKFLGAPVPTSPIDLGKSQIKQQRTRSTDEWRQRFIEESKERMTRKNIDAYLGMAGMARWSYRDMTGYDYLIQNGLPILHVYESGRTSDLLQGQEFLKNTGYLQGRPQPFVGCDAASAAIAYQKDHGLLVDPRMRPSFVRNLLITQAAPGWMAGPWIEQTNAVAARNGGGVILTLEEGGICLEGYYVKDDGERIEWVAHLRRIADFEYAGLLTHAPNLRELGWQDAELNLRLWRDEPELSGTQTPAGGSPSPFTLRKAFAPD